MIRKHKFLAFLIGLGLTAVAWAGLETVTHIQDLNTSWPLGSDLASTSDDHIRNIKSALKTDFPNFNGTYTSAAAPVFAIPSDTNTGMYSVAADDLGFSAGGTLRFDISTSAITSTLPITATTYTATGSTVPANGIYLPSANTLGFSSNTTARGSVNSTGNWTINAPSSGTGTALAVSAIASGRALDITGASSQDTVRITNSAASGTSFGLQINAGGNTSDTSLLVRDRGSSTSYFQVRGDGQAEFFDGTSSVPGASWLSDTDTGFYRDTANQIGIALGGSTAGQIAQGTFTGTLTGFTANPTGTVNYQRVGKIVTLWITASITATSNTTTMTMTGLPAIVQTGSAVYGSAVAGITNLGTNGLVGTASINGGTITFDLRDATVAAFSNSGTKGLTAGWSVTYPIS